MTKCNGLGLAVAFSLLLPMGASAQIAPRIMIAMDTSGSMALDFNGTPTWGDGVQEASCVDTGGGVFCGPNCEMGIDTDCDGFPNDSRMWVASEAVTNMILANGDDVEWSMSRFAQGHFEDAVCVAGYNGGNPNDESNYGVFAIQNVECANSATSYGNPQCNTAGVVTSCGSGLVDVNDWPASCRPGAGTNPNLQFLSGRDAVTNNDGDPLTNPLICRDYNGGLCDETAGSGEVLVGFPGLGAYSGMTNMYGLLRWIDHRQTSFSADQTSTNVCEHATTGDCELRPIGRTPLAGILRASESYMTGVRDADGRRQCRRYSVIMITDGLETCSTPIGSNPAVDVANDLFVNEQIRTYVVGMAIAGGSQASLNAIAAAGDTGSAFFANNQATLAAALSTIVADSIVNEVCNGLDDDCDGPIDEGVLNPCGNCGPTPTETCDGSDNDCDGATDEGVLNACGSCTTSPEVCSPIDEDCDGFIDEGNVCTICPNEPEICDGIDNDCDGTTDEDVPPRQCGTNIGVCEFGTQACTGGSYGACTGGTGPSPETCNNLDDDCDGAVDGFTTQCGSDVGECEFGQTLCSSGTQGPCLGGVGPSTEVCDGLDNNCMGGTDEGTGGGACGTDIGRCDPGTLVCTAGALVCQGAVGPFAETCNNQDDDCDNRTDEGVPTMGACGSDVGECRPGVDTCVGGSFTCVGQRGPGPEVCDGLNNDCDANTDEDFASTACGTDIGECDPGVTACNGGAVQCVGATSAAPEQCNTLDDDCDGLFDEGNPDGGAACGMTDQGECEFGALTCNPATGALVCVGAQDPVMEVCDGLDNDCDGSTDEMNPEGGGACGDDTGECMAGVFLCSGGMLICDGGVGPTAEICDGLDNDCDDQVDDGIPVGAPCGTDTGECVPGVNICRDGGLQCEGGIGPETEVCDNLDNDCDGMIDEGLGVGEACGSEDGLCMPGTQRCIAGRLVCEGEVGPRRETCDCDDNDCDGTTDEAPDTGELCPPGSACVQCQCALPCTASEFGFRCPTGRTPFVDEASGECSCVAPLCDDDACGLETLERDGETLCAPDSEDVAGCVCSNNSCTFSCDGVTCADGTVCDPRDPLGRCVENTCRGLGCAGGEVCDFETGECAADPCADVTCGADEACREGTCEATCAAVECGAGERCTSGMCETDRCFGVECAAGEVCSQDDGSCGDDLCADVTCGAGQVCDAADGNCVPDPCNGLRCPEGAMCEAGECVDEVEPQPDAGVDAGPGGGIDAGPTEDGRDRVLAAGGCFCHVGASQQSSGSGAWFMLALLGLVVAGRRASRRKRKGSRSSGGSGGPRPFGRSRAAGAWLAGLALVVSSGCSVEPFCLDCGEEVVEEDAGEDAGRDAAVEERDAGPDAGSDAGVDAGECPEESCNGEDDDCDGEVDEGIDTQTDLDNCGACGAACAPVGAFGVCTDGGCEIDICDVGRIDIDGQPENGCEYRCLLESDDDAVCDRRDNDCDNLVDEDVDLMTDVENCGSCGVNCSFAHGASTCVDGGCALGDCDDGWFDLDGSDTNGCEYSCTPDAGGVELCNGRDDDCDGTLDEGNPGGGASCGTDEGDCSFGTEQCVGGAIVCAGGTLPDTETCNGSDEDCDGMTDENNPEGGRVCGDSAGVCETGREQCMSGALVCVGNTTGDANETCDGLDNDCDGNTDEGNPGGGADCGIDTGECAFGSTQCMGGSIVCGGATGSVDETCNNRDDDCDGRTDENNPQGGGGCGTDEGVCAPGTFVCVAGGTLECQGQTLANPAGELCNSLDDDCDGNTDEGNPGGSGSCGDDTGSCTFGTEVCVGGAIQCSGGQQPDIDVCDGADNDCDGTSDEDFDTNSSINHCGGCNMPCSFPNAIPECDGGACDILVCRAGHVDLDGVLVNGCEYECDNNGAEVCNDVDDDCDGRTDEGLTPPTMFCSTIGVCNGTAPRCDGAAGWGCPYDPTLYEATEVSCDGEDNDCDGAVDEPFPQRGQPCASGTGICRSTGSFECLGDGSGTSCVINNPGQPAMGSELCNNRDDDCDGAIDEAMPSSAIPTVTIPRVGGGTVDVMMYEASRPDATNVSAGGATTLACSAANVLPWTNLRWGEADAACSAIGAGWGLCEADDWQAACNGVGGMCEWSYAPAASCSSSAPTTCNGYESSVGIDVTASSSFAMCFADWSASEMIYDLSGNVKEWTSTEVATDIHAIRGGAHNNIEQGRECDFDFTAGDLNFAFPHTGFRCCRY